MLKRVRNLLRWQRLDADIEEEHHDALTGHKGQGGEGRDYGEYYVRKLYREICKIKNPV